MVRTLDEDDRGVIPEAEILRLRALVPRYLRQVNELTEAMAERNEESIETKTELLEPASSIQSPSQTIGAIGSWGSFDIHGTYTGPSESNLESEPSSMVQVKCDPDPVLDTPAVEPVKVNRGLTLRSSPLVLKMERAKEIYRGFDQIPDHIAKKLFAFLEYRTLKVCRLVSVLWNKQIIGNKSFLESSVFHMNTNIEVIKIFENSSVDWLYIHFHGTTSENKTKSNYQQKFLQSKFQPYTITTNSLISLHLYKSEMGKDSLLRWMSLCKWLRYLEITDCGFVSSVGRTGWKQDPSIVALEHLRSLTLNDMILSRLVDTLKLLYNQIKSLEQLTISEKRRQPSQTKNIVATMESELISLIKRYMQKSRPKMRSLHLCLQKFENEIMVHDFFKKIPSFQLSLQDFGFEILTHKCGPSFTQNLCMEFNPFVTLKAIFKKSDRLKSLYIPGLVINLSVYGDISFFFPPSLEDLSAQVTLPDSNPESHLLVGLQKPECSLKKIAIHEHPMTDYQWMNLKKCFPHLTCLTVLSNTFGDHNLMTVSSCLVNLQVLRLEKVRQITDFGLTGINEEYLKSLKESWPVIPDSRCEDSVGMSNFPLVGKPISSIEHLREFHCVGSTDITDVGIAHGLFLSHLECLSIKGCSAKISDTGLDVLASNSPLLSSVNITLANGSATEEGIRQFISKLPHFERFKSSVEVKIPPKIFWVPLK